MVRRVKKNGGISVVVPTHAGRASVVKVARSLLNQECGDLEVIVVCDGDGDTSRALLEEVEDERLVVLEKENEGSNRARNFGLCYATREWVAFVDDDDIPRPNWCATWEGMMSPQVVACTAALETHQSSGGSTVKVASLSLDDPTMAASRIMAGAFLIRGDALRAIGGYDPAVPAAQNQDLGLRLVDYINSSEGDWRVVSTSDVVIDVYPEEGRARLARYGDRHARACLLFMERYEERLSSDTRALSSYHRILARTARSSGAISEARRHALRAWSLDRRNVANYASMLAALLPTTAAKFLGR